MTIRWHLAKLLEDRGITPYRLAQLTGLSVPSCYDLANAKLPPVVKTATLDKLCKALDCQPADLLEYRKR
jgi:putative transcriptional regulator